MFASSCAFYDKNRRLWSFFLSPQHKNAEAAHDLPRRKEHFCIPTHVRTLLPPEPSQHISLLVCSRRGRLRLIAQAPAVCYSKAAAHLETGNCDWFSDKHLPWHAQCRRNPRICLRRCKQFASLTLTNITNCTPGAVTSPKRLKAALLLPFQKHLEYHYSTVCDL